MIGQRLGTFLIEDELGSGNMGTVYRAVRETGKTRVAAIKVIGSEQMAKGKAFQRFIREIEILQKLKHANIVRYMAHGKSGKTYYYAMEYVPGPNFATLLADRGALFWVDAVRYAVQICDALHYSHEHGIVHRDLKPSNLMVTLDDTIKLTDFGIAKDLDATDLTVTGRTLGTPTHMAPEQFHGSPSPSHKTDLYALGVLMYQMLTGELPFSGTSVFVLMKCHTNDPRPRPSAKTHIIPVELDKLVVKLMAKEPRDRPFDAAAVAAALRGLLARQEANEEIAPVWPQKEVTRAIPTPKIDGDLPKKKRRKPKKHTLRERLTEALPVFGLILCLVAIGALIVYGLWWPSAEYLYDQAKIQMASEDPTDWMRVSTEYLDDLDRWYPKHKYKSETEGWRDRIALNLADRRAETIKRSLFRRFRETAGQGEELFAAVYPEADAALARHDDTDAARRWREMAAGLEEAGAKSERGWLLYANREAAAIEAKIADRACEIARRIEQADAADREGFPDQALEIRRDLLNRFGKYTDTAEALTPVRKMLPVDKEQPGDKTTAAGQCAPWPSHLMGKRFASARGPRNASRSTLTFHSISFPMIPPNRYRVPNFHPPIVATRPCAKVLGAIRKSVGCLGPRRFGRDCSGARNERIVVRMYLSVFAATAAILAPLASKGREILNLGDPAAPPLVVSEWVKADKLEELEPGKTFDGRTALCRETAKEQAGSP